MSGLIGFLIGIYTIVSVVAGIMASMKKQRKAQEGSRPRIPDPPSSLTPPGREPESAGVGQLLYEVPEPTDVTGSLAEPVTIAEGGDSTADGMGSAMVDAIGDSTGDQMSDVIGGTSDDSVSLEAVAPDAQVERSGLDSRAAEGPSEDLTGDELFGPEPERLPGFESEEWPTARLHPVRKPLTGRLVLNPRSMRQAVILSEILGPPKALR